MSNVPILSNNVTPFDLILNEYHGLIAPFKAEHSNIPGLNLHISFIVRADLPIFPAQTRFLADVMTSEAYELQMHRNKLLREGRTNTHFKSRLIGAFALTARHLEPPDVPITTVLWWNSLVPWKTYLRAIEQHRDGLLSAMMFHAVTELGVHGTMVVELHATRDACALSLDPRKTPNWYKYRVGITNPDIVAGASTIAVLLPRRRAFTREFQ